jgi:hypothetical protein
MRATTEVTMSRDEISRVRRRRLRSCIVESQSDNIRLSTTDGHRQPPTAIHGSAQSPNPSHRRIQTNTTSIYGSMKSPSQTTDGHRRTPTRIHSSIRRRANCLLTTDQHQRESIVPSIVRISTTDGHRQTPTRVHSRAENSGPSTIRLISALGAPKLTSRQTGSPVALR